MKYIKNGLMQLIIFLINYLNKLSTALSMCDKFHNEFDTIHSQLKKIQQRIMIQLKKIDELNYYRNSL